MLFHSYPCAGSPSYPVCSSLASVMVTRALSASCLCGHFIKKGLWEGVGAHPPRPHVAKPQWCCSQAAMAFVALCGGPDNLAVHRRCRVDFL